MILKKILGSIAALVIMVGGILMIQPKSMQGDTILAQVVSGLQEGPMQPEQPKTRGLLMFRGTPERNNYGSGNYERIPQQAWKYPSKAMCASSSALGVTKVWCGTGWTGQPVVWDNPNGVREIIFGAYDRNVHFVDAATGKDTRPVFKTGDIIKGSITMDPDGYPFIYFGSRDNNLRIVSLQQEGKTQLLWKLNANSRKGIWNDDWDGNPIIKDDILYEGGENGWFYAVKLNRAYDTNGVATIKPEIVFSEALFNDDLIKKTDKNLSIESSPLMIGDRVYVANSGGRIVGFDISKVEEGIAPIVFDYWAGDDIDATLTTDGQGNLYAVAEAERLNKRSKEVGQIIKLNPNKIGDPREWGVAVPKDIETGIGGGLWSTPAHYKGYIYAVTNPGHLLIINTADGKVMKRMKIGVHEWSSPSIVNDTLVIGLCNKGALRGYSLKENPVEPKLLWEKKVGTAGGCVESTPALYEGTISVGSRDGFMYHFKPAEIKQEVVY
ncbi:MAG TPA: hypothetical protein VGE63_00145 [Candidatus Paceibacterota bacterium]